MSKPIWSSDPKNPFALPRSGPPKARLLVLSVQITVFVRLPRLKDHRIQSPRACHMQELLIYSKLVSVFTSHEHCTASYTPQKKEAFEGLLQLYRYLT